MKPQVCSFGDQGLMRSGVTGICVLGSQHCLDRFLANFLEYARALLWTDPPGFRPSSSTTMV